MTKMIAVWIVLVGFAGAASGQPADGSAATAAAPAPSDAPAAVPAPAPDPRKACTDAMNADPKFAASIVKIADDKAAAQRDADTLAAHTDAYNHVQKNERHVIYSYAAMWIVAAGFVVFLWRRQQALQAEIAGLRRELDAAADPIASSPPARS